MFVKIDSTDWGSPEGQEGLAVANRENSVIYSLIRARAPTSHPGNRRVTDKLAQIVRVSRHLNCAPDAIIYRGTFSAFHVVDDDPQFEPWYAQGGEREAHYQGAFMGVPVHLLLEDTPPEFLVLSIPRIGRLRQYAQDGDNVFRNFEINSYPLERAQAVARGDRRLVPKDAQSLPEEQLVAYLRQHVHVHIAESLEVLIESPTAARVLVFPVEEPSSTVAADAR
jgi:hypothetical protein